jgi:ABC-type amino acid transport substrate-binding protein
MKYLRTLVPKLSLGTRVSLIFNLSILLLLAGQCQPAPTPPPTLKPTSPPPTPRLIPAIPHGDGSDLLDKLLDTGVIRVGVHVWPEASFSPPVFRGFSNARTGGALNGFEVDVAHYVAESLGLELELVEAYPPVIATGDWRGQWDIAIASLAPFALPPEAAERGMLFSEPYGYMPLGVFISAANDEIKAWADLSGHRVGVLEHSLYHRLLQPEAEISPAPPPNLRVIPFSNMPKAIRQLGQPGSPVEAIFGPTPILQEAIKSDLPVKLAPQAAHIGPVPLVIAVVPPAGLKADRLIAEINKVLARLHRQGTLSEMYLRWYEQDLSREP